MSLYWVEKDEAFAWPEHIPSFCGSSLQQTQLPHYSHWKLEEIFSVQEW